MCPEVERLSLSAKISELVSSFDKRMATIVESTTGKKIEFRIGRIIESLFNSGLDFYSALEVIERIEGKLLPEMATKDISSAIIAELEMLDRDWAKEFRIRYDEGIILCLEDSSNVPLRMAEVRKLAKVKVETIGYNWGGKRLLSDVTSSLIDRCRKLGTSEIPVKFFDQLFEQELNERLEAHSIYEYREEMPSIVASAVEDITNLVDEGDAIIKNYSNILTPMCRVCKALLFYFGFIPPMEISECMGVTVTLFDRARSSGHPLRIALMDFKTAISATSRVVGFLEGKKYPEDFVIEQSKAVLRKLSFLASKQSRNELATRELVRKSCEMMKAMLLFLAEFSAFLWPEDWLAASTLQKLRRELLRNLFRYRCLSIVKLTRILQVHPKHTLRALVPLKRDGLVTTHRIQDGELVLITTRGEQYCENNLGLKLRYPLSSL